jgi:hypothetical protein
MMNLNYLVVHVRFFGINKLGCIFCRLRGCSGLGARTELEAPSSSTGLLATGTTASCVKGIGRELVG